MKHSITTAILGNDYMAFNVGQGASYNQERMRIDSVGNIGISTSSPAGKLHIVGGGGSGTLVIQGSGITSHFHYGSNEDTYIRPGKTAGQVFIADVGGNVGIGTTNTSAKLHVTGSSSLPAAVFIGNVGIGTTNPQRKFHVEDGSVFIGDATYISTAGTNANGYRLDFDLTYDSADSGTPANKIRMHASSTWLGGFGISSNSLNYHSGYNHKFWITATTSAYGNLAMIIDGANGNVGIGSSSPAYKLDVAGSIYAYNYWAPVTAATYATTDYGAGMQVFGGTGSGGLTNTIKLLTNGSERARIDANGNFGIGTSAVSEQLDVYRANTGGWNPRIVARDGTNAAFIGCYNGQPGVFAHNNALNAWADLYLNTTSPTLSAASGKVFIGGNVGIGTSNPGAKLQVSSSASTLAASFQGNVGVGNQVGYYYGLCSLVKPTSGLNLNIMYASLSSGYGEILMSNYNDNTGASGWASYIRSYSNPGSDYSSILTFGTCAASTGAPVERMRITATGNVGIGTTSVTTRLTTYVGSGAISGTNDAIRLQVSSYNDAARNTIVWAQDSGNTILARYGLEWNVSTSQMNFVWRDMYNAGVGSTELMRLTGGGSVGIGTSSPASKLHVVSSVNTIVKTKGGTSNNQGSSYYVEKAGDTSTLTAFGDAASIIGGTPDTNACIWTAGSVSLIYHIGGSEKIRFTSDGNVGIGTSSPSSLLNVSGTGTLGSVFQEKITNGTTTLALGTNATAAEVQSQGSVPLYLNYGGNNVCIVPVGSGNVGIGTTSPSQLLHISSLGTAKLKITADTDNVTETDIGGIEISQDGGITTSNFTLDDGNHLVLGVNSTTGPNIYIGTRTDGTSFVTAADAKITILNGGNVGIGTTAPAYKLEVNGSFAASTKSFKIDHPTKPGKKLVYGSLESPYHGIRLTGKDVLVGAKCVVKLPDYICKLVRAESVAIQLTGIKCNKLLYIDDINVEENYFVVAYDKSLFESNKTYEFFWDFTAIRSDVPELITEL